MISKEQFDKEIEGIIANAIREDVGDGDHSSLACIPASAQGKGKLLVKDNGIIAGVEFAKQVFAYVDSDMKVETLIEDGWVTANGTTLGADNGIGVAAAMAVLQANDLVHGPVEALITMDEEAGMTGANALKPGILKGDILLNMDLSPASQTGKILRLLPSSVKFYCGIAPPRALGNRDILRCVAKYFRCFHQLVEVSTSVW